MPTLARQKKSSSTWRNKKIPVTQLAGTSHKISAGYSRVVTVDKARDSVDYALMGLLSKEDIVVTQDFGLAAMVLGKGARALNQNGLIYTNDNIDELLYERHVSAKIRRSDGRTKGPSRRSRDDDARFETALLAMLNDK